MEINNIPWSPVLRYATPLPMNRTPVSTIGGPFRPFCGTPHPSRSIGPPFRPWEVRFLRFTVRQPPPDQQDPVSNVGGPFPPLCSTPGLVSIACSVQALPMNTTTHSVPTQPVGSHAFRCLPMNTTTHSVPTQPVGSQAFRCLPMNTTHFVASP